MSGAVPQPFGPDEHKATAHALGVKRVADLCAQTPQSDPFYCGTPADHRDAEWFAHLLETIGLDGTRGIHLRRVHYRADALADDHHIRLPHEDRRYSNDRDAWKRLCTASKHARRLGLVDPEVFVDRRNPDPVIHRWPREHDPQIAAEIVASNGEPVTSLSLAHLPDAHRVLADLDALPANMPTVDVRGFDYRPADQPVLVEIWCEKTTMTDVLEPVARRVHANYVPASGTQSMTAAVALLRRVEQLDRPAHVLYVSDHDHAGRHMPVSVARDLQYWRDRLDITVPVTVDNLVLTADQVDEYRLPRDPERGNSTELDALEALRPGELDRIVYQAAAAFVDHDLEYRLDDARAEAVSTGSSQWNDHIADLVAARDELVAEVDEALADHRARLGQLANEIDDVVAPYRHRLAELRRHAVELVASFDPDLPDRPAAADLGWLDGVLYDSRRGWLDQLDAYRAHKGGAP